MAYFNEALNACAEAAISASGNESVPSPTVFAEAEAGATELFLAARRTLGPEFVGFEPDTLWRSFDVETVNRDQLMAAIALATNPSFYWDFRAFGNTALAFGDYAVVPDTIPRPTARDMSWAAYEAELLNALSGDPTTPEFDDEVLAFIATALHEEGFVLAPDFLEDAQEALDKMTSPVGRAIRKDLTREWETLKDYDPENTEFADNALGVQLARLAEVRLYLAKRAKAVAERLRAL